MKGAITLRFATAADCGLLLRLIRELATFERAPDAVIATEADLCRHGFGQEPQFEAILAFELRLWSEPDRRMGKS